MPRCRHALTIAALLAVLTVLLAVPQGSTPNAVAAARGDWSVIAHRGHFVAGSRARHTENTMAALKAAHRAGAPAVEVDLVVTADRQPLVMHDATLSRTTTCSGPVAAQSLADIRARCRGRVRGERIPSLEAVLGWAKVNRRNLVLDLKSGTATWTVDQLQRLLDSVRSARMSSRVSLLSFYGAVLTDAEELDPTVRTQWISGKGWPGAAVAAARADAVSVDAAELTRRRVRALHQHGVEAFGRVANRPAEWRRLRRVGVDGLLTDRSDDYLRWRRR